MKIVFLDIDGVMNAPDARDDDPLPLAFRRSAVLALNRIVREADARIVISSTWRISTHAGDISLDGWGWLLKSHGVMPATGRVVGVTRMDEPSRGGERDTRAKQIRDWLILNPRVERAVVLDDDDGDYAPTPFIRVNPATGLTDADATQALSLLLCGA